MSDFSLSLSELKRSAEKASGSGSKHPSTNSSAHSHSSSGSSSKRPRYEIHSSNNSRRSNSHYQSALKRALASVPRYQPPHSPPPCHGHVCLLFIIIDELPFQEIWKTWATAAATNNNNNNVTVSVVIHAKFAEKAAQTSDWVQQRLLVQPPRRGRGRAYAPPVYHSRRPEWGSIEITRAMLDLLHEGLFIGRNNDESDVRFSTNRYRVTPSSNDNDKQQQLPPVDKFIFCSETCIPVTTLQKASTVLFQDASSWVNFRDTPNNGYSRQLQFERVNDIPTSSIYKADQWMILTRPHAEAILQMDRHLPTCLYHCFLETRASDELYFPTALSLLGILPRAMEIEKKRVTYADWSESARNPVSFCHGLVDLQQVAKLARKEGCLFARKFTLWSETKEGDGVKQGQDTVPPGYITVKEWEECIDKLEGKNGESTREPGESIVYTQEERKLEAKQTETENQDTDL